MNKKLSIATLLLLLFPLCIESFWNPFSPAPAEQSPTVQALELACTLKTPYEQELSGFNIASEARPKSKGQKTANPEEAVSLKDKINELKQAINAVKIDELNPVKKNLNQIIPMLSDDKKEMPSEEKNAERDKCMKLLQELYHIVFEKITLKKWLGRLQSPYLQINKTISNPLKEYPQTITDLKNIVALLWLKFIDVFTNNPVEISFTRQGAVLQKLPFTPLRWAYYSAHAGMTKFEENNILNTYSKPFILAIFKETAKASDALLTKINDAAINPNLNKDKFIKTTLERLANLYKLLFLKNQTKEKLLKLLPEFQDAFPAEQTTLDQLQNPSLPRDLELALTKLASIWLKLIKNDFIKKDELIVLSFPEIKDPSTKTNIGATPEVWMHQTACAGYTTITNNNSYKELIKNESWVRFRDWSQKISSKVKGFVNATKEIFVSDVDDLSNLF